MDQKQKMIIEKQCIDHRLTISQVKARVVNDPLYFNRDNLKANKVTIKSFHIHKTATLGVYHIYAEGFTCNKLERFFNAFDNMLYYEYDLAVKGE